MWAHGSTDAALLSSGLRGNLVPSPPHVRGRSPQLCRDRPAPPVCPAACVVGPGWAALLRRRMKMRCRTWRRCSGGRRSCIGQQTCSQKATMAECPAPSVGQERLSRAGAAGMGILLQAFEPGVPTGCGAGRTQSASERRGRSVHIGSALCVPSSPSIASMTLYQPP